MPDNLKSIEELQSLGRSTYPEVRIWALDKLINHYADEATLAIASFLRDDAELVAVHAAIYLAAHPKAEAAADLTRALHDQTLAIRPQSIT